MDTIKSTFNQASESIKGTSAEAKAKKDKGESYSSPLCSTSTDQCFAEIAKGNTDADLTTRAEGVKGYVENTLDQKAHEVCFLHTSAVKSC
jgi:hypothetical protein